MGASLAHTAAKLYSTRNFKKCSAELTFLSPHFIFGSKMRAMDERDYYTERMETKTATYTCPKCRESGEFEIRWLRRSRKKELPRGASQLDRAKFAKARDYMVRVDDMIFCPNQRCRSRFEIPNSQTVVFV